MITVEDALALVLESVGPLPPETVSLAEALGRSLAEDVVSDIDLPPFDKALMDGYAVRSADLIDRERLGGRLRIGESIVAGQTPSRPLAPAEAAPITTGAPLPEGADAVVMIERTQLFGGEVLIEEPSVVAGQNRLIKGRELQAGQIVLRRGEPLNPPRLGVLASVGKAHVSVSSRPRLAIAATGDELIDPDRRPGPGQIRNSNSTVLRGLAEESGTIVESFPIVPDEEQKLAEALSRGLSFDVLLVTGGVSAGHRDLVPATLDRLGVARRFHKVQLKPGKPIWFGVGPQRAGRPGTLVFGLPGNPVSGLVGFLLFVRPALAALAGRQPIEPTRLSLPLAAPFHHRGDRPTCYPARLTREDSGDGGSQITTVNWAGSADLLGVAQADGFAMFPAGDRHFRVGEIVPFLPFR
jgi:molybdopterin molybdotransferase